MGSQFSSKRIFKNTILLYLRMIIVTVVSFFTVRITLQILGVEDYGIYNVVGGLVAFLSIISSTMSSATQRYLAFDLGKNDYNAFQNTFSLLMLVYLALSFLIIVIGEAIGPWVISTYLKIPTERVYAAQWVYQFSLFSFCLTLIGTPYQASIIANEKMGVFAFIGLFDAIGKLVVTYLLYFINFDKLIIYAFFIFCISLANYLIQWIYCRKKLQGCKYKRYWDKNYLKEILGYTGWNLFGAASSTLNTAGVSLVLNLFFGPLVNAAKGIADRINSIVVSFSVNFYQAIAPQIVKTYAAGEYDRSRMLVYRSSKLSFFLLFVISLPLIYGMPTLLNIWLGAEQVTDDMVIFSRLILVYSLVNVFEQPITMIIRATGNIKKYQICVGIITLLTIPICVVLFWTGLPAYWSILSLTLVYVIAMFIRLRIARVQVNLSTKEYLVSVVVPIISVIILTLTVMTIIDRTLGLNAYLIMVISFFVVCGLTWAIGLKSDERRLLLDRIPFLNRKK